MFKSETITRRKYRPEIDGLRAVAVLMVIVYHGFPHILPGGYVGVDVFFVISGYLISGILLDGIETKTFSIARFYNRRIRRIFPPLLVILAAVLAYGWFQLLPQELMQLGKHVAASAGFIPNILYWSETGYFDRTAAAKPLLHLWSLGVEEQFYLIWPLALLWCHRSGFRFRTMIIGLLAVSFLLNIVTAYSSPASAFFLPFQRAWELMMGAFVARVERRHVVTIGSAFSAAGFIMICVGAVLITPKSHFPGWWALLPAVGTALVIASDANSGVGRVLQAKPLQWIGLISYALYLWHWPLLSFAFIATNGTSSTALRVGVIGISFALSVASYFLIERPVRTGRSRWQVVTLCMGMAGVAGAGLALFFANGVPTRFPSDVQAVLRYEHYDFRSDARVGTCWLGHGDPFSMYDAACFPDPRSASKDGILVWGDSHAARFYPGLRAVLGPQEHIAQLTRDSCGAILGALSPNCAASNSEILKTVRRSRPHTVILFGAWFNYDTKWAPTSAVYRDLGRTLAALKEAKVQKIILMGPAPKWIGSLPALIYRTWAAGPHPAPIPERLPLSNIDPITWSIDARLRSLAAGAGISFFSVAGAFCNRSGCLAHVPNDPTGVVSWDGQHLTTVGATFLARKMVDAGVLP